MYSIALMMALSGGAETVGFGHRCSSCACSCSCTVSCHSSCHSRGHGCCHGGGLFSRFHGCHGCCTSACSSSCCHVSHSSCCTSSCHGCCHGGGLFSRFHNRCHGCNGCNVVCSSACCGTTVIEKKDDGKGKGGAEKGKEEASNATPATIVVNVPADAKLTVDGNATRSTSARRTFVTPALETGDSFVYTIRAEVVVDGQNSVQTQNVTVRGGQTTEVNFTFAPQGVASR